MKARDRAHSTRFPPKPRSFRGRARDLATLEGAITGRPSRIALIGAGGSGKSTLACALGHRVRSRFPGGIHWFRVGAWDVRTLAEMLGLRLGVPLAWPRLLGRLRDHLLARGPTFIVLDNHEDDRAVAALLDALREPEVAWVITARRCLLAGVSVFPVVPPLITSGESPFPAIATLTRLLRWNPVALDLADAIVTSGAASAADLEGWLLAHGVDRVRVIEHEDDLPEVHLLVAWAWPRLMPSAKRMLAVLAHTDGDHVGESSLAALSHAGSRAPEALAELQRYRLVQEPFAGRFALHATVRHAVQKRTKPDPDALFQHYVGLLERDPSQLDIEQTHLFAAMDQAHTTSDLDAALRVQRLLMRLEHLGDDPTSS
jgi:hypothetical protein